MRNLIGLFAVSAAILTSGAALGQKCKNFHHKHCYGSDNPYMRYNVQSKSGTFILGHTSDLVFVGHAGQDYRISLCQDSDVEEPVKFKIIDSRSKNVLFDNEKASIDATIDEDGKGEYLENGGLPMFFEFSAETTKKIIIRITAPGPPPEEGKKGKRSAEPDPESLFCIGVLLENMPTPQLGF